jgi:hypothetical protein
MENTSLLASGFTLDDLRVEALEPRLEFSTAEACNPDGPVNPCGVIRVYDTTDPDFQPLIDTYPCPSA